MIYKLLVVEDDQAILEVLQEIFVDNGYSVETASNGALALKQFKKIEPDLVILDLGLPDINGETVCIEMKKLYPYVPIVILTAKGRSVDIVHGLNIGADDYISKPFVADELLARVKAQLRRLNSGKMKISDLELDMKTFQVKRDGKTILLTPKEFNLLQYLIMNKGRVLTREMILNRVWRYDSDVDTRVVDVYIGYLRKKIDSRAKKKLIHSLRGFGYTIKD